MTPLQGLGIYLFLAAFVGLWMENGRPEKYKDKRYNHVSYVLGLLWPVTMGLMAVVIVTMAVERMRK